MPAVLKFRKMLHMFYRYPIMHAIFGFHSRSKYVSIYSTPLNLILTGALFWKE
jgi:hypothetical protein